MSASSDEVSLREVTRETVRAICDLQVAEDQRHFVAPNAISIAEAYFEPRAWFRAVYAREEPVGFVMLYADPEQARYFLWRFMIDARHQRRGYGRRALELLVEHVRARPGASELLVSCVPGERSPEPFYAGLGFARTGLVEHGEIVLRLPIG